MATRRVGLKEPVKTGPKAISAVLLAVTIILYTRPQSISQVVILAVVLGLTVLAALSNANSFRVGGRGLHAFAFGMVVFAASFVLTPGAEAVIAGGTLVVPLAAAVVVGNSMSLSDFARVSERTLLGLLVVSVVVAVVRPAIGLTQVEANNGTLRGIYPQRNVLGAVIILAVVFTISRWVQARAQGVSFPILWRYVIYLPVALWCGSTTALGLCVIVLPFVGWRMMRSDAFVNLRGSLLAVVLAGTLLFPILILNLNDLLGVLNKTASFDGRLAIWSNSLAEIAKKPWTGYGRGVSLDGGNAAADYIAARIGYYPRSFHNSFIGLAVESGIGATVIGAWLWLRVVWGAFAPALLRSSLVVAPWPALVAVAYAGQNLVENVQFREVGWFMLCCSAVYLDNIQRARIAEEKAVIESRPRQIRTRRLARQR